MPDAATDQMGLASRIARGLLIAALCPAPVLAAVRAEIKPAAKQHPAVPPSDGPQRDPSGDKEKKQDESNPVSLSFVWISDTAKKTGRPVPDPVRCKPKAVFWTGPISPGQSAAAAEPDFRFDSGISRETAPQPGLLSFPLHRPHGPPAA